MKDLDVFKKVGLKTSLRYISIVVFNTIFNISICIAQRWKLGQTLLKNPTGRFFYPEIKERSMGLKKTSPLTYCEQTFNRPVDANYNRFLAI